MQQEQIHCTLSWYSIKRRDCMLATIDEDKPGFQGLSAAQALLLFSFRHEKKTYPCALLHWFTMYGQRRDPKMGLWQVQPAFHDQAQQNPCLAVSLDVFKLFYVNKYADYHSNEIFF
ncbi:hypothetical protein DFH05DRAFT_1580990 [Lentinula detonsa]|uniref:Uncharacterized protein n=1 Tax=Lentinula detonsa TaxID=2804962 RepID=A0A9W8NTB3_9AGAR|nr:hypothetical protein DFH05DRAFT_1580990 [Lentinula detonsa]